MALELEMTTPHGVLLERAYCNIDFISFTKRHEAITFNMTIYRDREAFEEGLPPIPDIMIVDNIPISSFDTTGNLFEQIYNYVKDQALLLKDPEYFIEVSKDEEKQMDLQYSLLKETKDV